MSCVRHGNSDNATRCRRRPACLPPTCWRTSSYKEAKCFFPTHSEIFNIMGSLRDREVACSASDRQGSNSESCVFCHLFIVTLFSSTTFTKIRNNHINKQFSRNQMWYYILNVFINPLSAKHSIIVLISLLAG